MILYYALILLIPFNKHPFWSQPVLGLTPIKWVGGATVLYAFFYMMNKRRQASVLNLPQAALFSVFFFLAVLSLFANYIPVRHNMAFSRLISLVPFFFASTVLIDTKDKFRKVLVMAVVAMCIGTAYIVRDYAMYSRIYGSGFRPGGSFGDANYYALSAVAALPLAYYLFKTTRASRMRLVFLGSMCFITLGIIVSLSRGGLLALFVALYMIFVHSKGKLKGTVLALIVMTVVAVMFVPSSMWDRFRSMKATIEAQSSGYHDPDARGEVSAGHRLDLLRAGIGMVKDKPLQGVGIGMFKPSTTHYLPEIWKPGIAHNTYMEVAAEAGLPALAVFLALLWTTIRDLKRAEKFYKDEDTGMLCTGLRIGLVAALVAALFLSAEYEKMLWLSIFSAVSIKRIALTEAMEARRKATVVSDEERKGCEVPALQR